jgi:anti-sigma regulatory factor (Ser/Thr protein kinase)
MSHGVQPKGEKVRKFILQSIVEKQPDLVAMTAKKFALSRQGVRQHIDRLKRQGAVMVGGNRRKPRYALVPIESSQKIFLREPGLEEHHVWDSFVRPAINTLPKNILGIWNHAFTEMFNNAIDHSECEGMIVNIEKTSLSTEIRISDDGVGIFKKIRQVFELDDERHAIFELSKGKLTTDPANHSGEGIFFSSRMLDHFSILSGELYFSHNHQRLNDYLLDDGDPGPGTSVSMALNNHSSRTTKQIFDQYSGTDGEYGFNKTVIPVGLANYGADALVSRSQAKRVLARVNQFERVVFDFDGVETIGQGFADQIFRVYAREHPELEITCVHTTPEVESMIRRAKSADPEGANLNLDFGPQETS